MDAVSFDVERPATFQRAHVVLRIVLLGILGWIGHPFGLLWLGVPAVAAILVAQKGGRRYVDEDGPRVTRILGWILAVLAYLALLTDRLPGQDERPVVRFEVERSGSPTVGSALRRILTAIPSAIVLALLMLVGAVVWWIALVVVLVKERYPESWWRFFLGIVRRQAVLLAHLASLVGGNAEAAAAPRPATRAIPPTT